MDNQQMDRERTIHQIGDVAEALRFDLVPALAVLEATLTHMSDENEADGEGGIADQISGVRALASRTLAGLMDQANHLWQIKQSASDLALDVYGRMAAVMEGKDFEEKLTIWRQMRAALGEEVPSM